jgi:4-carboxymuconolactone decarboxylase|tara:strand:- start:2339 stop:2812 length:474 start_codon:yes stop_codon:yes gene_type:complete
MGLAGPFGVWVRAPAVGNAIQQLGAAARFATSLDEATKEIAICTVGAHYKAKFELAAHKNLAMRAGISAEVTEAIHHGAAPDFATDEHRLSYQLASQLLNQHRVDDATYRQGVELWGESGMIELVSVIGHYCIVSLTLNTFEIPVAETMQDPFPELP